MSFALGVPDLLTADFTLLGANRRRPIQTSRLESRSAITHHAVVELDGVSITLNCDAKMVVVAKVGPRRGRFACEPEFHLIPNTSIRRSLPRRLPPDDESAYSSRGLSMLIQ